MAIRNIQHGFTKGRSGLDHVIALHCEITGYMVTWRKVHVIYFSFSKACPLSPRAFLFGSFGSLAG